MSNGGFLLGLDIGSSAVKAALVETDSGRCVASATSPKQELEISAPKPGWAEQQPETWWEHARRAIDEIRAKAASELKGVKAIGISYQMHGLVAVDADLRVLRPAIIWCDSRAVEIGAKAFASIGAEKALSCLLNSPGNFTASKLRWVMENEPEVYRKIHRFMLPGDYIAARLTGEAATTVSGLSEGILWNFKEEAPANLLLSHFEIARELVAPLVPTFGVQGRVRAEVARELGISPQAVVSYRAGDQPNNALSLNVLEPGEIAATAGTSGVVYGVGDKVSFDPESRVNTFVHVNHKKEKPRYGTLLCINGTGILNSWLRRQCAPELSYAQMDELAAKAPPGAAGLSILPYGNGAERSLGNRDPGALVHGLRFTQHTREHVFRAAQEGIVYSLNYGLEIMRGLGIVPSTVRAGRANMFLSPVFREAFASTTGTTLELFDTDGAQGAARGAGIGAGLYNDVKEAFSGLKVLERFEPDRRRALQYREGYARWRELLETQIVAH
jgi:xylulokinase